MSDPIAPPSAPAPTGPEMSTGETLTGIFFEPSRTFEALRVRPRFLVAGLIVLILTCLVTAVMFARVDMAQFIRDQIEKSPRAAGKLCVNSNTSLSVGSSKPIWTIVLPGGNGPCTVTRVPLTAASGDDPGSSPDRTAPDGRSNANGFGGFTGEVAPLTMSRR